MKSKILSKLADKKFERLGFTKIKESDLSVSYEKRISDFNYTQCIDICHMKNVPNIAISYQAGVNSEGFNNAVGLSAAELKAVLLKMKAKGF